MKWRNGKFEKIVDLGYIDEPDRFQVLIYQDIGRELPCLVDWFYFPSRALALRCAAKYRLSRIYPGRLLGGDFRYE